MTKYRTLRRLLNALMLGASIILLADAPSPFHGFMLGMFLIITAYDVIDIASDEKP